MRCRSRARRRPATGAHPRRRARSTLTQRLVATPEAETRSAALIPTQRIAEPADIAHAFSFLLSAQAAHVTGQVIRVDGGQGLLRPLPRAVKA